MRKAISVNGRWRNRLCRFPVPKLAKNPRIFGEGGEGRSGYEVLAARRERNGASFFDEGQAEKSARGMPWHQEPTKDVTSCDKPRVGANIL